MYGNGDCHCNGLGQVGLTLPASTSSPGTCSGLPIVEYIKCQAEKIFSTPRPVPVYTPPYSGSGYPETYPGEYSGIPQTDWTPYLIGGLILFMLTRK